MYATFKYVDRYKESDLIKLDIQINGDPVEPLSTIVHKDKVINFFDFIFVFSHSY